MARDDFFHVEFDIENADWSKLNFCIGTGTSMCANDGFQFEMTKKGPTNKKSKINVPYDRKGVDNHYALQRTVYKDVFQCSVEMTRGGDRILNDVKLFDYRKDDVARTRSCYIGVATGTCGLEGLPHVLNITKIGALGTTIGFEYAHFTVNRFWWDSKHQRRRQTFASQH